MDLAPGKRRVRGTDPEFIRPEHRLHAGDSETQDVSTATLIASRDVSPAKPDAEETSTSPSPTSTPKAARDAENSCTAHVDHLVVGAGISRIGVTRRLSTHFPSSQIAVLGAKEHFGGTWWTHTFPGIRSDSDLYSYGYKDRPWTGNAFATGKEIHDYLGEVIDEENLAQLIHYNRKVTPRTGRRRTTPGC